MPEMHRPASSRCLKAAFAGVFAVVSGLVGARAMAGQAPRYVWIEAEKPTKANFKFEVEGTGLPVLLSDGKWLRRSLAKDEAKKAVPAEGFLLRYDFGVPEAGEYELWARVGFEGVRAPLEWRVGDGAWARVSSETHTTSLMRLGFWMEVAWERLGAVKLGAGRSSLELRFREPGRDGRMLVALDCLALVRGRFVPEGRLKPDETYDGEADRAAAQHVFRFPASTPEDPAARVELPLNGTWQIARYDDPNMDANTYEPVQAIPSADEHPLRWMAVQVPLSLWNKPEMAFGHRSIYRTRVAIPKRFAGRSFVLHFSGTNWIVSVFANGRLMGTHRGVLVPWDIDITRGVRPGEVNEIAVAVKGSWYAHDVSPRRTTLEGLRNLPQEHVRWSRWVAPIYPSTKGEGDGRDYGIINPLRLIVAGPAYVWDVFVRPSVARRRLDADLTLSNPTDRPRQLTLRCQAVHERSGKVERQFGPVQLSLEPRAHKQVTVGGDWPDPRLWWPVNEPELYILRTTVLERGRPIDIQNQLFGFREITLDGIHVRLNGVIRNFWNWVEVSGSPSSPKEWLKRYRAEGNRYYRFADGRVTRNYFPYREARLEFYDRNGIPGRLSSCIDGMFINYDLRNPLVWENFREHIAQETRAYRNHPSIFFYSVENELIYINGQNVFGGIIDQIEQKMLEVIEGGKKNDPTRPYMVGGGGALKGNRLEIHCPHYPEAPIDYYPDNAFTLAKIADHSSRWPWDRKRPMLIGECFFYAGKLERQAWIGGDRVFRGRDEANRAASKYTQLIIEGYRWQGVAAICPWVADGRVPGARKAFSDLAAFTRKRSHRFYAGRQSSILVKVFNDTFSDKPVSFQWAIEAEGNRFAGNTERLSIEPGTGKERTLRFQAPKTAKRLDAELVLRVSQEGKVGFEDRKPVAILPPVEKIQARGRPIVYDRSGKLAAFLQRCGLNCEAIETLAQLKGRTGLLLVGPNTLTAEEAYSTAILGFAAQGGRAIVLEQDVPLAGTALPAPVRSTQRFGGYAFAQALGTPVFRSLRQGDFEDWAGDHPTFLNAYVKPAGGARSLIECGDGLNLSAMIEAPCGRGVIVASQMRVGAKLGIEPAADHLLANLIEHYATYTPPEGTVAVYAPDSELLRDALAASGALTETVPSVAAALDPGKYRIAVIHASARNLGALQAASGRLARFTDAGSWLVLWGLEPAGLKAYNALVGWPHAIRPFRIERVTLEAGEHPVAATLGNRDVTFYSTRPLLHGDYWLSGNVYTHVVDGADIAPFCQMPGGPADPFEYKPTFDDHDPYNFVNGMLGSDFWRYIQQIWIPKEGPQPLIFRLRQPATIRQINIWNNTFYWTIKDLDIIFDDDKANPMRVVLPPSGEINELKVDPPRRVSKSITLQTRTWRGEPIIRGGKELRLVGIDNVQFLRQMPPDYERKVRPIDNVGGLVAYPRGKGGILLCQIKLMAEEPNKPNKARKIRLLATLLQNLGAGLRASSVVVPGVNVRYVPIDITRYCNRHIKTIANRPGWFGDRRRDLRHLNLGQQYHADVLFHISDYATAPVPKSIMLAGPKAPQRFRDLPAQVKGIAIGRKADALFFLHAAYVNRPVSERERRSRRFRIPEVLKYVVRYADGSTAEIPVRLEEHIENWLQREPRHLPGARVAWSVAFPKARPDDPRPVLYSMTWNNVKPDVAIASLDVVLGRDGHRAVPAVLAITAGVQAVSKH